MAPLAEMFRSGGPFMYICLLGLIPAMLVALVGLAHVVSSFRGTTVHRKRLIWLALGTLGLALAVVGIGGIGHEFELLRVQDSLAVVEPSFREEVLARGLERAAYPLWFALYGAAFPAVASLLIGLRGALVHPPREDDSPI